MAIRGWKRKTKIGGRDIVKVMGRNTRQLVKSAVLKTIDFILETS
jgi:hypothetical protein